MWRDENKYSQCVTRPLVRCMSSFLVSRSSSMLSLPQKVKVLDLEEDSKVVSGPKDRSILPVTLMFWLRPFEVITK